MSTQSGLTCAPPPPHLPPELLRSSAARLVLSPPILCAAGPSKSTGRREKEAEAAEAEAEVATAALSITATLTNRTRRMTCDDGLHKDDARCRSTLPRILPRAASAAGRGARPSVVVRVCRMRVRGAHHGFTVHAAWGV